MLASVSSSRGFLLAATILGAFVGDAVFLSPTTHGPAIVKGQFLYAATGACLTLVGAIALQHMNAGLNSILRNVWEIILCGSIFFGLSWGYWSLSTELQRLRSISRARPAISQAGRGAKVN